MNIVYIYSEFMDNLCGTSNKSAIKNFRGVTQFIYKYIDKSIQIQFWRYIRYARHNISKRFEVKI